MRTTIDLPDDLHELARQLAHDSRRSMSEVIADLIRLGLPGRSSQSTATGARGIATVSIGRPVTAEDVRSLEDE